MIINLDIISWQFCIIILLLLLFFIYLFFGGGDYEYIGLSPLEIGCDASGHPKSNSERNCQKVSSTPVDNTPELPDLEKIETPAKKPVLINRFSNSGSKSYEQPSVGYLVDSYNDRVEGSFYMSESEESFMSDESFKTPMTPRTVGLGPHKCHVNGFISKGEKLCKQAIEEIYGKPFFCVRPNFLKNPETNRNLEIDIYNDELKIGIEYSGKSHFVFPNSFHKTYEEFINQIRRDQFKIDTCDANGVYLITVPYNVPLNLDDIKKYITYYLPENVRKRSS